jgi:hypothetical protein
MQVYLPGHLRIGGENKTTGGRGRSVVPNAEAMGLDKIASGLCRKY